MRTDRLLKLADALEADAHNPNGLKFDLSFWGGCIGPDGFWDRAKSPTMSCDTSACAIGLACVSGMFKEEGLGYKIFLDGIVPVYQDWDDWQAVERFFDIDGNTALNLFSILKYDHVKGKIAELAVAERIRTTVSEIQKIREEVDA